MKEIDELASRRLKKELQSDGVKTESGKRGVVVEIEEFKIEKSTRIIAKAYFEGRYDLDDET